jgi:AcrR family transcriptional regulator
MSTPVENLDLNTRIMAMAEALLLEIGDDFTIEQLSSRMNVSRATIYRRIGSKAALLRQLAHVRGPSPDIRDTRRRILDAVPKVIGRYGLTGVTMEQIAEEASIGVATVYRHFGEKDRVIQTFVEEWTPQALFRELIFAPSDNVAADLTALAEAALINVYQHRDVLRVVLLGNETEQAYLKQIRGSSTRLRDLVVTYFETQQKAGRMVATAGPQDLALAFVGMLFGFAMLGPIQYGTRVNHPHETARLLTHLFLDQLIIKDDENNEPPSA